MHSLTMSYKGDRTYLHGTDFFNEIERVMQKRGGWLRKLVFRKFAAKQCDITHNKPDNPKNTVASGIWELETGEAIRFWIIETLRPVNQRKSFEEDDLLDSAVINKNKIFLNERNCFSTIENVVTLTKYINYHLSPNVTDKWVFGQIDLESSLPKSFCTLTIEHINEIKSKFSLNSIEINNVEIGKIRFILGAP